MAAAVAAVATGFAILMSPLVLQFSSLLIGNQDWEKLSYIGQTYGAIAAYLTALSLGAIAVSLSLQARALSVQMQQHAQSHLLGLVTLAIQDEEVARGGPWGLWKDTTDRRVKLYSGLWISHFAALYNMGFATDEEMRNELHFLFAGSAEARARWATARSAFQTSWRSTRAGATFFQIADEVFQSVNDDLAREAP